MRNVSFLRGLVGVALVAGCAAACGSEDASTFDPNQGADGGDDAGTTGDDSFGEAGFGDTGATNPITSLEIDPPTATLDVTSAPFPTQQFTAKAHFQDGSTGNTLATWSASDAPVGSINGNGLYATRGTQGGSVTVTATAGGKKASAKVTVLLHQIDNPAGIDAATQAALLGATTPDGSVVWTYPYDGMAYPRGLNSPNLMWNNGVGGDVYAVHITSPTYELQVFTNASAAAALAGTTPTGATKYAFDPARWATFADSTSGDAKLTVTRKSGGTYTKIVDQTWKIASRSMSGTIYYWAINKAAVVRIKPGAAAPDYFLQSATVPPGGTKGTTMFCPSCHTASADGSTLAMGTGEWGSTKDVWSTVYNLASSATTFYGYETSSPATRFPLAGLTPDGKVLVENWAKVRGNASGQDDTPVDLSNPSTAVTTVPMLTTTGLEGLVGSGHHTYFPVFSADNQLFAYVDSTDGNLYSLDWNATTKTFTHRVELAAAPGSGNKIAYPTLSPDHRWVVYQVGPDFGSLGTSNTGDLYAVDTTNPMQPIALAGINTSMSAAAGTTRDQHRSYEPTFAPVASGGYFWLVFHSRRTYGNTLVDVPYVNGTEGSGTKQLWVAALDVAGATAQTSDPSHPPFWLTGQDPTTRNMRGYWALEPCKQDGASCATGTDCCNGFCDATDDAGTAICGSTSAGCAQVGDRCNVASDCCATSSSVVCINHVCSEQIPK